LWIVWDKSSKRHSMSNASIFMRRDVQDLLGHASLSTTQRYLEPNSEAKRRLGKLV
jgi:site-specific recombinase XerD